jgi:hypothetical protein
MNAKDALKEIRIMLGMEAEVVSVELAEATLVDGTVVKVEGELEVGKQLYVVTEDGDVPAPEGIHETTEGLLVTVDANGVITNIESKPEEEVEVELSNDNVDLVGEIAKLVAPLAERLNAIEARFSSLDSDFQQFKSEPAAQPVKNNWKPDVDQKADMYNQRMQQIMDMKRKK